jgi:peptide/nickel transport system substrate-binding protein
MRSTIRLKPRACSTISEFWREIGVKLFVKPQDRTVLRNRAYSGLTVMVAAEGLDNALPTPVMPPTELAPMSQAFYAWPKWGQFVETKGKNGEACDLHEALHLLELYRQWMSTGDKEEQIRIWREMLQNHAENQWSIGTVAGALQPIVVKAGLKNVPERAPYSWEPTAMLGIYRTDEFYWERAIGREARLGSARRGSSASDGTASAEAVLASAAPATDDKRDRR